MKQETWLGMVNAAMASVTIIDAPKEVGLAGHFEELLEDFLVNRHRGNVKEDILSGRPWTDSEAGRHFFRLRDLMNYLEKNGMRNAQRGKIVTKIRELGGGHDFFNIKGKGVNTWWIPVEKTHPTPPADLPPTRREII